VYKRQNKTIQPVQAERKESRQLLLDYLKWLPDHFANHSCDLTKLEKLDITIWTEFDKAFSPPIMDNTLEFTINALTIWKADGRKEQTIRISQIELMKKNFLKLRFPEFK